MRPESHAPESHPGRKVRFGGKNLPPGRSTWYDHRNPDGSYGGQIVARPGDEVDAERIGGPLLGDDGGVFRSGNTAGYYIDAGMAEYDDE